MPKRFDLTGKVAVVTGILGKLGTIWAEALLDAGSVIYGIDKAGMKESGEFIRLMEIFGADRIYLSRSDITVKDSVRNALNDCLNRFGTPDILVNNAGIDQPPGLVKSFRLEEIPADIFMGTLTVNLYGTFLMTQIFGGEMARRGRGSIINIGSLYAGVSPDMHFYDHLETDPPFIKPPAYGASKAGVVNLTKYFSTHWGGCGVRVNTLSPGGVLGGQDEDFKKKFTSRVPLGRMADFEDLKGPIVFLASDAASYVTGIELMVDGGFTAW